MTTEIQIILPKDDLELIMKGRIIRIEKDGYVFLISKMVEE